MADQYHEIELEHGIKVRVYYTIEEASGDGWDEPRTPRHAAIYKIEAFNHFQKTWMEIPEGIFGKDTREWFDQEILDAESDE